MPEANSQQPDEEYPIEEQGYLYHEQKPDQRRNPRRTGSAAPPRREIEHDLVRLQVIRNTWTFIVAAIIMFILLLMALYAAKKSWEIRQAHSRGTSGTQASEPLESSVVDEFEEVSMDTREESSVTDFDTDAIRKAVFLAKRGRTLEENESYDEAIEQYREALDIWPQLTRVWAQMGQTYLKVGDLRRAKIALERAIENDPGNAETLNDLGVIYLRQNLVDKALELFQAASEIDVDFAESYFNIALCHLAKKEQGAAREAIRQYLNMKPDDPRALKERAYLEASEGEYKSALLSLERAIKADPDWPPLYFDAAATCALMGRVDEALSFLERVEEYSSPGIIYRVYQEPAFREIRITEKGAAFEKFLAERAREDIAKAEEAALAVKETSPEPLPSTDQEP